MAGAKMEDLVLVHAELNRCVAKTGAGRCDYKDPGDSDEKVAARLGVSMVRVANMRRRMFGKLNARGIASQPQSGLEERVANLEERVRAMEALLK